MKLEFPRFTALRTPGAKPADVDKALVDVRAAIDAARARIPELEQRRQDALLGEEAELDAAEAALAAAHREVARQEERERALEARRAELTEAARLADVREKIATHERLNLMVPELLRKFDQHAHAMVGVLDKLTAIEVECESIRRTAESNGEPLPAGPFEASHWKAATSHEEIETFYVFPSDDTPLGLVARSRDGSAKPRTPEPRFVGYDARNEPMFEEAELHRRTVLIPDGTNERAELPHLVTAIPGARLGAAPHWDSAARKTAQARAASIVADLLGSKK